MLLSAFLSHHFDLNNIAVGRMLLTRSNDHIRLLQLFCQNMPLVKWNSGRRRRNLRCILTKLKFCLLFLDQRPAVGDLGEISKDRCLRCGIRDATLVDVCYINR